MIAIWVFGFPIFRETHFRFPVDPEALSNLGSDDKGFAFGSSGKKAPVSQLWMIYPLVICYIAIENGHRNSGFSHWK